jgi:pilus assembly protein TadC
MEMQKEGEDYIKLPSEINGVTLAWKEKEDHLVIKIVFLEILVMVLLFFSRIEKKKQKEKEKQESMELDYPKILGQMTILLGAGMTIPQVIHQLATQYIRKKQMGVIDKRVAYEELVYMNRRIQEGESEREALLFMEQRTLLMPYRRLIRILLNNKSKGADHLCQELEKETSIAYAQRVDAIKQKGEEASTKMLAPLMLMMIVVIAIVILPACLEFAG